MSQGVEYAAGDRGQATGPRQVRGDATERGLPVRSPLRVGGGSQPLPR